MNARVLESMGYDHCGEVKRAKAPSVLARVRKGNVTCSICKTKLSSTQSLRSHIRSRHLEESQQQFKCLQYNVACGGAYALKVHMRVHSATGRPHLCAVCGKSFATIRHLHQHQVEHTGRTSACQYCGKKTFTAKRFLLDHEKRCADQPGCRPVKQYKCNFCDAAYYQQKDLNCHRKSIKH